MIDLKLHAIRLEYFVHFVGLNVCNLISAHHSPDVVKYIVVGERFCCMRKIKMGATALF